MQEAGPTKFLVGSEHGIILSCTKRPKKQAHRHVKLQRSWDLGVYQMFKPCCVSFGLGSAVRRSRPGHCCLCTCFKSQGAATSACPGGNWNLVWFGRSWRLWQALWSGVFREAQPLPCEVLPVRRGLVRKDVDGRAERRSVKDVDVNGGLVQKPPHPFLIGQLVKAVERSMQSWGSWGGVVFFFGCAHSKTHSQTYTGTIFCFKHTLKQTCETYP